MSVDWWDSSEHVDDDFANKVHMRQKIVWWDPRQSTQDHWVYSCWWIEWCNIRFGLWYHMIGCLEYHEIVKTNILKSYPMIWLKIRNDDETSIVEWIVWTTMTPTSRQCTRLECNESKHPTFYRDEMMKWWSLKYWQWNTRPTANFAHNDQRFEQVYRNRQDSKRWNWSTSK